MEHQEKTEPEDVECVYIVVEHVTVEYTEYNRIKFVSFSEREAEAIAERINEERGFKYAADVIELDIGENDISL